MSLMSPSRIAKATAVLVTLSSSLASAAPVVGLQRSAGVNLRIAEPVHERPMHSGYTRVCNYGPRGWMLRNHRGQIIACRPSHVNDLGWTWREEGGRSGWYHSRDRVWR
jgi:hypothetical protein